MDDPACVRLEDARQAAAKVFATACRHGQAEAVAAGLLELFGRNEALADNAAALVEASWKLHEDASLVRVCCRRLCCSCLGVARPGSRAQL